MPKEMYFGKRDQASHMIGERRSRQIDQIETLRETDRPPGPPVHRNGMDWLNAAD